jgi:hypothetical protein
MIKLLPESQMALAVDNEGAIAAGLVDTVAPLDRIAAVIVRSVREGGA